jgi:transposase
LPHTPCRGGKELQRTLGVTYKTAWRMGQQIRTLMKNANGFEMLQGHVESDEAFMGGYRRRVEGAGPHTGKTTVITAKERGGRMIAEVIENVKLNTIRPFINKNVKKGSIVSTDELRSYLLLKKDGYIHGSVNHKSNQWTKRNDRYQVVHHTNSVESFWRLFKQSVSSTHIHVSKQHMQKYLDEFAFRSNHRQKQNAMFDLLVAAI